jgi:hypothetical protein
VPLYRAVGSSCAVRLSLLPLRMRERGQLFGVRSASLFRAAFAFGSLRPAALASLGHPRYSRSVLLAAAVPVSYKSAVQVLSSRRAANYVSKRTAGTRRGSSAALLASGRLTRR